MTLPEDPVLACSGLRKAFGGRTAVDDVTFSVAPGECYGLLGPNGAGKTTTISMVAGLLEPDTGEVVVAGSRMTRSAAAARASLGLVPQQIALYPDLTARENLTFFGRFYGLPRARLARRVDEVLDVVGLADRAGERVEAYSGGMQRRLNIAAGMLHEPPLLLLDEPTAGVDPQSRNAILAAIEALGGTGLAVLYTTHYMEEAERLCDRVGILDEGRLVAEGTQRELVGLVGQHDLVRIVAPAAAPAVAAGLRDLPAVVAADSRDGVVEAQVRDARSSLAALLGRAAATGAEITSVEVREPDLEAVFLHLTGKALRD